MHETQWTTERVIRAVAGTLVLAGLALGLAHSSWWLCLTAFAGLNLLQSAFTRWCLLESILIAFGLPPCGHER
jgi:hypothetical protein